MKYNPTPKILDDEIARYFTAQLGSRVCIKKNMQSFPGASRETHIIIAEVDGQEQGFTLRVDPPSGGGSPFSLKREFGIYQCLWDSPVPVAEPLWYDDNLDFAQGRPHMVRRLVEGGTSIAGLTDQTKEGARLRREVSRNHIEHLAQLHLMDWKQHGLSEIVSVPQSAPAAFSHDLDIWKKFWLEGRTEPIPLMTEAIHWMEENIPTDTTRISLVKGNNGVGEEIFRDNRIVALSDWEMACLADGAMDLACSQGTLDLDNFADAIKYYGELVGEEISPQRLAFSDYLATLKYMVCCETLFVRNFLEGRDSRIVAPTFAVVCQKLMENFTNSIGKDMVSAHQDVFGRFRAHYADIVETE